MKEIYWNTQIGPNNFGDEINTFLWHEIAPYLYEVLPQAYFSGIGTILNDLIMPQDEQIVIIGSGIGYGPPPKDFYSSNRWKVVFVRGPLTASILKIEKSCAISDPALLIKKLADVQNLQAEKINASSQMNCIFIPHHDTMRFSFFWEEVCNRAGIELVSPLDNPKNIFLKILSSQLVCTESLHGAICADALGVPWIPIVTQRNVNSFKWWDYCASVQLEYNPMYIEYESTYDKIRNYIMQKKHSNYALTQEDVQKEYSSWYENPKSHLSKKNISRFSKVMKPLLQDVGSIVDKLSLKQEIRNAVNQFIMIKRSQSFLAKDSIVDCRIEEMMDKLLLFHNQKGMI